MVLKVAFDREEDGRWIADIPEIPGVTVYGATREEALRRAVTLALDVLARRVELGELPPDSLSVSVIAA